MPRPPFDASQVHQVLPQLGVPVEASSEKLGWSSSFASVQRELPFGALFEANANCLIVSSRRGPADVTYRINGRVVSRQVQHSGVFFLPAGHACDVKLHTVLDTIHLYLPPDLFRDPECDTRDFGAGLAPILGEGDGMLGNLLAAMEEMVRGDQVAGSSLVADAVAPAIANRLIALNHHGTNLRGLANAPHQLNQSHVRKIRDFVETHLADDIKLHALAELCGLSTAHFIRRFKSTIGVSPYQYVMGLRVGRAKALLCGPERPLAEIARDCGFSHQQHLISTFRRVTGVTPGAYRRG
jgi:AraC family transcriptional regulator